MTGAKVGVALLAAASLVACDPNTTRPAITPSPASLTVIVSEDPGEAIAMLAQRLKDDSIPVARLEGQDAWLESPWIDSLGHPTTARPIGPNVIRLRAWADPAKVGSSTLTIELSWRPTADPSIPQRELDRDVSTTLPIAKRVAAVIAGIKKDYGGE
ncbi:MAG: hypothetical protein ACREL2_11885 [Gemmatimonadales bacterium]